MKKLLAGLFVSGLCIGTGIYLNLENNLSTPVVETSKTGVSKHEDIDKPVAVETKKEESLKDGKKSEDTKFTSKSSKQTKSESKSSTKTSVSSESKQKATDTKSEVKSNTNNSTKAETKNNTNTSKKEDTKPVEKPSESVSNSVVEPTPAPTPEPTKPSYACPGGVNQDVACDVILDPNFYYATYSSMSEADAAGLYYMNDVMYIGETEITNYSVQPVYRNDHSIAYYGLNLWSNGSLIQ